MYPLYALAVIQWTVEWIWAESVQHHTAPRRLLGTLGFLVASPWYALTTALRVRFGRITDSREAHAQLLPGS